MTVINPDGTQTFEVHELETLMYQVRLQERWECARIAETVITGTDNISVHEARGADKAAAAIRART